jgi:hypothetical protein
MLLQCDHYLNCASFEKRYFASYQDAVNASVNGVHGNFVQQNILAPKGRGLPQRKTAIDTTVLWEDRLNGAVG